VVWAEAYLHTKWYLDPSNRLATVHERRRQTNDRQTDMTDRKVERQKGHTDNGPIA